MEALLLLESILEKIKHSRVYTELDEESSKLFEQLPQEIKNYLMNKTIKVKRQKELTSLKNILEKIKNRIPIDEKSYQLLVKWSEIIKNDSNNKNKIINFNN